MNWKTKGAVVATLAIMMVGVPSAVFAAQQSYNFTIDPGYFSIWRRTPANSANDYTMAARGSGTFLSEIYGCPASVQEYGARLRRNRTGQPDEVIGEFQFRSYCAATRATSHAWSAGTFHFDVVANRTPTVASNGFVATQW